MYRGRPCKERKTLKNNAWTFDELKKLPEVQQWHKETKIKLTKENICNFLINKNQQSPKRSKSPPRSPPKLPKRSRSPPRSPVRSRSPPRSPPKSPKISKSPPRSPVRSKSPKRSAIEYFRKTGKLSDDMIDELGKIDQDEFKNFLIYLDELYYNNEGHSVPDIIYDQFRDLYVAKI